METATRSKEQVKRDVEMSRHEATLALENAKEAWTERNPAVIAWRAGKQRVIQTKERTILRAYEADHAVRDRIYQYLGVAVAGGALLGLFLFRSKKTAGRKRCS
jgi:ElaB/YqjD/DUF883 family membrane-anchored ribosome-binding protein